MPWTAAVAARTLYELAVLGSRGARTGPLIGAAPLDCIVRAGARNRGAPEPGSELQRACVDAQGRGALIVAVRAWAYPCGLAARLTLSAARWPIRAGLSHAVTSVVNGVKPLAGAGRVQELQS